MHLNGQKIATFITARVRFLSSFCLLLLYAKASLIITDARAESETKTDHSQAIQLFLDSAKVSMGKLEFTTPLKHNAYQLYRSVLLLDSRNTEAIRGVETIRVAYVKLLDQAVVENDIARIRSYYHRAKGVGVAEDVLELYKNKFDPIVKNKPQPQHSSGITVKPSASIDDAFRLRRIGKAYQSQKIFDRAEKVYRKLIEINSNNSDDWLGLAVSLDSMGRLDEAVEAYQRVVYLEHSNPKIVTFSRHRVEELSTMVDK